jgi:NAD(P)-dependent dehydrogenase (short-subunit alcohol dehydrogenase family)
VSDTGGDDVRGRSIIVTGAGHGIGRGVVHHLARCGASVVVGEYVPRRLERIMGELSEINDDNLGRLCDVRHREDIDALVAATVDRFGRVDAIINNAVTYEWTSVLLSDSSASRSAHEPPASMPHWRERRACRR